ncbi:MAG TPA: hypothetical protein DDY68_06430 [Porphyromonadaceae bacterium]|nr:hypothetical protein [Porphyromonadaceae bacterium]
MENGSTENPNDVKIANNINGYLVDADNIFIENRPNPLCNVPEMGVGNKPIDGGFYLFTEEEMKQFILEEPKSEKWFRPWYGGEEFLNNKPRYCLLLQKCPPEELRGMPKCMERARAVKEYRLKSKREGTVKLAETPLKFHVENFPESDYMVIPETSSEGRKYIPIGFFGGNVICSNAIKIIRNYDIYEFGILTSIVHNAWVRAFSGRLKSDYRYSVGVVYNNFIWVEPTQKQREEITQTAQAILDARALYPNSSLADLYDPIVMPEELRKAHTENDRAVLKLYGLKSNSSEEEIVQNLMQRYKELTEGK